MQKLYAMTDLSTLLASTPDAGKHSNADALHHLAAQFGQDKIETGAADDEADASFGMRSQLRH